jgi:hypothetical protein
MLQAGRSPVRVPNEVDFSIYLILPASERNEYQESSWGKKRPVRRADNLAAIYEPMSGNVGASTSRNPKGLRGRYRDNFSFLQNSSRWFLRPLLQ